MSLLDKFRKKGPQLVPGTPTPLPAPPLPGANPVAAPSAAEAAANTAAVANLAAAAGQPSDAPVGEEPNVRAFDEFGREVLIPISQWRRDLLPQALDQAKNDPDAFSGILLDALQTGGAAELVPAAAHLHSIDTNPERGAAVHGLVLLAANQPAEAEDVLVTYLGQFGPSATILTHLARAQATQNRLDEADATLWRAIEANPNDEAAVGLYAARSREREGDFGWQSSLERVATLPGAWLPLLWLGRSALEARNRTLAVGLYKQAIESSGRPAPTLLLQSVSGDLGQFGLLEDALRLVRPAYDPEVHGIAVGNNLLRATLDSGQPAEALTLVRDLARLNQPEMSEQLRAWEIEIRRRDLMAHAAQNPPQPQLLRIDGPIWLPPSTPSRQLYQTESPRRGTVLFLGSSVALPEQDAGVQPDSDFAALADSAGRLSRALPLYLAENAFTLLTLDTQTLVPWADIAGFAMLSQPWPDDAAAAYARDAGAGAAVTTHIEAMPGGATVTMRVVPAAAEVASEAEASNVTPIDIGTSPSELTIGSSADGPGAMSLEAASEASVADRPANASLDGDKLSANRPEPSTVTVSLTWPELHSAVQSLWPQLAIPLVTHFGDTPEPPQSGRYAPPRGPELNIYLRLLEQLLGINCATTSRNAPLLVTGERETLRTLFDLALRNPNSLPVRLMLGELLLRVRGLHPEVLNEFVQPLRLLAERHPFPETEANNLLQAQQSAALSTEQPQA